MSKVDSTDAEATETTTVAIPDDYPLLRTMVARLRLETSLDSGTGANDLFVMDVMEGILAAGAEANETGNFDAIFEAQESGMVSGQDFAGRPFLLKGEDISIRPSAPGNVAQGGFTHYAIMKVWAFDTGEMVTLNCGGKTFMVTLDALYTAGYFTAERGCPEEGRPLIIVAVPSPAGAYLKLQAFKLPEAPSASKKKN